MIKNNCVRYERRINIDLKESVLRPLRASDKGTDTRSSKGVYRYTRIQGRITHTERSTQHRDTY